MNISEIKNCYGCGTCAAACGKHIISINLNKEGFYEPHIEDIDKCVNCGLCVDVCAYLSDNCALEAKPRACFTAWSKEYAVRRKCSSGGVAFELGRSLIEQGYKVCGVRYNAETGRAEHYIATSVHELIPSIGSKYIQSYTFDGFNSINRKEKYLVTGTPCQIDSFRHYIRRLRIENNFVLLDFFCHGVPSMLMWQKYVKYVEETIGKITYASWRNKFTGWHDSWTMAMDGTEKGERINWHDSYNLLMKEKKGYYNSRYTQGDLFYAFFLGNSCLSRACYNKCKYKKAASSADIRIGDCWGKAYEHDQDGVSSVLVYTEKGERLLRNSNCELTPQLLDLVTEGQLAQSPRRPTEYEFTLKLLRNTWLNLPIINKILYFISIYKRIKRKLLK